MSANTCLTPSVGTAPATFAGALQFFAAAQCLIPESWPKSIDVSGKLFNITYLSESNYL